MVTLFGAKRGDYNYSITLGLPIHPFNIMDNYCDYELEELRQRVENFQRQNQILKLESEIPGFQRDIGDASAHASMMSTPMARKSEMSSGPRKLKFCISPG